MSKQRRQFSAEFKFRVRVPSGWEAVKGQPTISELASKHSLHPNQISQWKRQLLEDGVEVFTRNGSQDQQAQEAIQSELYEQIGRLKMELEWLKKKLPRSVDVKRTLIEPTHAELSLRRQCGLLGLNRSTLYYQPAGESAENLQLMRLIDEQYLRTPFYGWPRMTAYLRRAGHQVNHKRVQRLMHKMGLQAIYPKPKTSLTGKGHTIYPSLLGGLEIVRPNQVWSADITYVPLRQGFMYLVAIMDWFSCYVLTWQLSNTLDGYFCLDALQQALHKGQPAIFNTDQGAQFTADAFTDCLARADIQISMDGRGRALDNIFIERLWRSVKYEDIYLKDYATVPHLELRLADYFSLYNEERPHQALDYRTPAEVYFA
jgi:putative transposase